MRSNGLLGEKNILDKFEVGDIIFVKRENGDGN